MTLSFVTFFFARAVSDAKNICNPSNYGQLTPDQVSVCKAVLTTAVTGGLALIFTFIDGVLSCVFAFSAIWTMEPRRWLHLFLFLDLASGEHIARVFSVA